MSYVYSPALERWIGKSSARAEGVRRSIRAWECNRSAYQDWIVNVSVREGRGANVGRGKIVDVKIQLAGKYDGTRYLHTLVELV